MIIAMPTTARPQQRYDHRLRNLVQRTSEFPARRRVDGSAAPMVVVGLDVADLTEPQLRQEVLKLRRRVQKLAALLRLAVSLLRTSEFSLNGERLPDGRAKMRILRAVDRAHEYLALRTVLRFLRMSPSRFHAWRRRQRACALDDQSSCPRTSPYRLTPPEVWAIKDMVTSPEYRQVPIGTLAVLAQRLGKVWASPSTWYRLVRKSGWRRPRLRVHPAKPKIGLRTTCPPLRGVAMAARKRQVAKANTCRRVGDWRRWLLASLTLVRTNGHFRSLCDRREMIVSLTPACFLLLPLVAADALHTRTS